MMPSQLLSLRSGSRSLSTGQRSCPCRAKLPLINAPRHLRLNKQTSPIAVHALPELPLALADISQQTLLVGAAATVALAGLVGWQVSKGGDVAAELETPVEAVPAEAPAPPPLKREDAVLVLGATGRVGRRIVRQLLRAGRTVVAGVRSANKAEEVFQALGVTVGLQQDSAGVLFVEAGLDVTNPQGFAQERFWKGVSQVVSCLGTVTGPLPEGGWGILEDMSPERVEGQGLARHLVSSLPQYLTKAQSSVREVLSLTGEDNLAVWEACSDIMFGGTSSAALTASEDGTGAVLRGDLMGESGSFCGVRTKRTKLDLSGSDGIELCVKGDGRMYFLNIMAGAPEEVEKETDYLYQTTFDTVADTWTTIRLPWNSFVPCPQDKQSDPRVPAFSTAEVQRIGLSRTTSLFNMAPNPDCQPGSYELQVRGGISTYQAVRPQIIMVSSAGVERNAIIGDDLEARKKDIPIVQLNPAGTLNWKYTAETAVRASGYPYCIVRATGMEDAPASADAVPEYYCLDVDQGDTLSGQVSRDEVAEVLVAVLNTPEAVGKTFEVRRSEALDGRREVPLGQRDWLRLFCKLSLDRHRWRVGLRPFPKPVPPPAPATEERVKEILQDVARVRQARQTVTAKST